MGSDIIVSTMQDLDQSITDIAGQLAPTSQRVYLSDATHFAHWIQDRLLTLGTFTRTDMIAYRSYLDTTVSEKTTKRYSKATKQRMFSVACRLMNEQYISGRTATKVTSEVKGFKSGSDETTHTALTKKQAIDMLASIDTSTIQGKRDYAIMVTLLKTGLRRAELVALNAGNITMRDGHHVAIIEHGKGDKLRIVKLRVEVARAIEAYKECLPASAPGAPLFVSIRRGDHPTPQRITDKGIELLVKKWADITPHGMRASFATITLEEGAPLHQVQYAMGHSDPRTTERYQKRKLNLDNNAVDYMNF